VSFTSQRVFIVVYFVIDSVRKLLNAPSYNEKLSVQVRTAMKTHVGSKGKLRTRFIDSLSLSAAICYTKRMNWKECGRKRLYSSCLGTFPTFALRVNVR
jgi:hypothetical protein